MSTPVPTQQIVALNDAESSENRIHSDDIAAKYGFSGALVSGVNVFGYMSQPLVAHYGEDWLSRGVMEVKFIKPAYQDELLSIRSEDITSAHQRHHLTCACNEEGVLLARLESWLPAEFPPINELAYRRGSSRPAERLEIAWDLVQIDEPAAPYQWRPGETDNLERVDMQRDVSPLYRGEAGFIHPYYLLDACNKALMRMFILPAWIHTGSRLILRRPLRVGQAIEVRAVPVEKWERKGNQFIKLYVSMWESDELALEVEHTAIFRIAG